MVVGASEGKDDGARQADLPFRQVVQHIATPCWISDNDGQIVWVNDAWIDYTGMTVETIAAEGLRGLHDPEVYGQVVKTWDRVKRAGVADEMVFPLRGRDGRYRPFLTRVTPLRDPGGRTIHWFGVNTDVSVQSDTEAKLRLTREELREVFDRAGDGIFITDEAGRLVDVNEAACAMGQYCRAELLHMSVWDLIEQSEQGALASTRAGEDSIRDWKIRRKDGSYLEVEVTSRRLSDGRRLGVARDVTGRRLAEQAERRALSDLVLAQSARATDAERQLRHFWDASQDLFAIVSAADGVPRMINERAWMKVLDFSAEHITSTRLLDLVHPDDVEKTLEMRRSHLAARGYFGFENRYLRKDGDVVWLSWNVVREDELIYCNGRDITHEKRAQAELARTEGQFRLLVDGVVDYALFMLSPSGLVSSWNAGAERIKGYSAGEIIGRHVSVFYTEADRAAGLPARALGIAAEQGRYEAEGWRVRKDGSLFWANVILDVIRDEEGTLVGYAKITRDITERRNAQLELQRANERLAQAQKMEALGQLTGGIAHDFNNLLTGIIGAMNLLKRRIDAGKFEDVDRFMDAAVASSHRAAALTHRLLAFARRQPLDVQPVNLDRLIHDMEDFLRRTLGEQVALDIRVEPGLWPAKTDANQLENALINLAVNGRDAMPDGGRLSISAERVTIEGEPPQGEDEPQPGDYTLIRVSDSGMGMTPETRVRAFDPFFTTKPVGQGTGLGLSMIYGFVKQSNGYVGIDSTPGEGTCVSLYLPRHAGSSAAPAAELEPRAAPHGSGEMVLLIEDEPSVRMLIAEVLRDCGYASLEASDGQTALPILTSDIPIDLLITDVGLPGMNGRQVAEIAREHRPDLKILFVTGYAAHAMERGEFLAPGMDMVTKPFALDVLAAKIREMIEGAKPGPNG